MVIMAGAYYGSNRGLRGQGFSTFLCGVRKSASDPSAGYVTVCKVGTGYSASELHDLRTAHGHKFQPYDHNRPPECLNGWVPNKADDRPHLFIRPEDSFVLQIKCGEIVVSDAFLAGYTCRFPRVQRIREDKPVDQVMTLAEFFELRDRGISKKSAAMDIMAKLAEEGGVKDGAVNRKGKRKAAADARKKKKAATSSSAGGASGRGAVDSSFTVSRSLLQVDAEGSLFEDTAFCIMGERFPMRAGAVSSSSSSSQVGAAVARTHYSRNEVRGLHYTLGNGYEYPLRLRLLLSRRSLT
jgi:ATP dependent DNA ligase C terminal region